jgi:hypothetical protein
VACVCEVIDELVGEAKAMTKKIPYKHDDEKNSIPYKELTYGFRYGPATITRCCSDEKKGWVILSLETPKYRGHEAIQIYVTKTGKVRVLGLRREPKP